MVRFCTYAITYADKGSGTELSWVWISLQLGVIVKGDALDCTGAAPAVVAGFWTMTLITPGAARFAAGTVTLSCVELTTVGVKVVVATGATVVVHSTTELAP
jgi:hypothetical protein